MFGPCDVRQCLVLNGSFVLQLSLDFDLTTVNGSNLSEQRLTSRLMAAVCFLSLWLYRSISNDRASNVLSKAFFTFLTLQ